MVVALVYPGWCGLGHDGHGVLGHGIPGHDGHGVLGHDGLGLGPWSLVQPRVLEPGSAACPGARFSLESWTWL